MQMLTPAAAARRRFMTIVREQMAEFEKKELAFKAAERRERITKIAQVLSAKRPETSARPE